MHRSSRLRLILSRHAANADRNGQQVVNSVAPLGEPLPRAADPDVFARVIETRQPVIGDLRIGQIIKQPGFPVHVPVIRNGQVIYVLSALITSAAFGDVLRREPEVSDEWVRGVVDAGGVAGAARSSLSALGSSSATTRRNRRYALCRAAAGMSLGCGCHWSSQTPPPASAR